MKEKYSIDYFINKFTKIPAEMWIIGKVNDDKGRCCALGFCNEMGEMDPLVDLFKEKDLKVPWVNDGKDIRFNQKSPKTRIIAALKWIKEQNV